MDQHISEILRSVRNILLPFYGNAALLREKNMAATDPVTELDEKIEVYLAEKLRAIYPDIGFVGEENGGNRDAERFWLADPIDGTGHFMRGLPFCSTMLALVEEGAVTRGAIYDFVNDVLFFAEKGKGATRNGTPIHVSNRPLRQAYMCLETHLDAPENMKRFDALRKRCMLFHSASSGYEFSMVASGKLDGRVCFDPYGKDYDFAPGMLLVAEAGGIAANLGKRSYDYRNLDLIATSPKIYKELAEGKDAVFPLDTA